MNAPMRSCLQLPADHPAYAGHFPAFPVLPGAVLIDAALDAVQRARQIDLTEWQIGVAKFLSAVRPGDPLQVEHDISDGGVIHFKIRDPLRTVASGTLLRRGRPA